MDCKERFIKAMIPILEQESGLVWGPQSVGRIVEWTLTQSDTQIVAAQDLHRIMHYLRAVRHRLKTPIHRARYIWIYRREKALAWFFVKLTVQDLVYVVLGKYRWWN